MVTSPRPRVVAGPRAEDLDQLARMLAEAGRPLVLVGGALLADAIHDGAVFADLNRLSEEWVLPISPTHRRPQLFDATHPNYGGYMGIRVPPALLAEMKRADLMVALGERMTDSVSQSYNFPTAPQPQLPFVHVWPDPNEVGRVWRPDLGMPCSPYEVVKALLRRGAPGDAKKRRGWVDGLNTIHRKLLAKEWEPTNDGINFAAVVCEVDKHLAPDATVTTDAGNFASFVHRYIGFRQGQVMLASVVGAMGSGMPMAVAAALRRPGTPGRGLCRRRRRIDDRQRDRHRPPIRRQPDHDHLGQRHVRHDRHAFLCALSRTPADGRHPPDQSGFRPVGPLVWRRGHHDQEREPSRRRHRPRLCRQDQASGRALPDLGNPDERLAPLHPLVGDGGALMTGNEIATARQYGANPIMIISDNGMYGTIGMHSYVRYPERPLMAGTRLTNPDFAQWGRSFGAEGITIKSENQVADGIARAFAVKTRPVVVHCLTSAIQMSAWRRYTRSATLP